MWHLGDCNHTIMHNACHIAKVSYTSIRKNLRLETDFFYMPIYWDFLWLNRQYVLYFNWATSCQNKKMTACQVWSESSLCTQWVADDPRFLHVDSEDSDQTGQMPRLIWVFAGRTCHIVGWSWGGSTYFIWYCVSCVPSGSWDSSSFNITYNITVKFLNIWTPKTML